MAENREAENIRERFKKLCQQAQNNFPQKGQTLDVPPTQGVYVIRKGATVLHVGRTVRGKDGLHQRLTNHLRGSSSFTREQFEGKGEVLRDRKYTFQYLEVESARERALLEAFAIGSLCPEHLGLSE